METLVANLKLAMGDRIRGNSWMAPATKEAALAKLNKMDVMVGHPRQVARLFGSQDRSRRPLRR